jgi:hypothetical protein
MGEILTDFGKRTRITVGANNDEIQDVKQYSNKEIFDKQKHILPLCSIIRHRLASLVVRKNGILVHYTEVPFSWTAT